MIRTFTRNGWLAILAASAVAGLTAIVADGLPAVALVNESRSLPRGLYLRRFGAAAERGAIAAARQPVEARAYLADLGAPADMLILKRVAAVGGDRVCRHGARLETPGGVVALAATDRRGARLPAWSGCRPLAAGELFLLGDTATSFDSRYFGPVRRDDICGVYRAVMTW